MADTGYYIVSISYNSEYCQRSRQTEVLNTVQYHHENLQTRLDAPSQKEQNNPITCHCRSFYAFLYSIILLPLINCSPSMQWDGSNSMRADVLLQKIDSFLGNHQLKLRVPKEIVSGELLPYIPKFLMQNIPAEIRVPLSDSKPVGQGKLQQA